MILQTWLLYLGFVLVATATPGPAVLYIVTSSASHGWKKASLAALGNVAGLLVLGILAVAGLGAVVKTSALLYGLIKYCGAAYLIYLGIKMLSSGRKSLEKPQKSLGGNRGFHPRQTFCQAMGVALSNPKAILFLTALFPQFLDLGRPLFPQFLILIVTLMFFSFFFLMLYAIFTHKAKLWCMGEGRARFFTSLSGIIFILFGFFLATAKR